MLIKTYTSSNLRGYTYRKVSRQSAPRLSTKRQVIMLAVSFVSAVIILAGTIAVVIALV